MNSRSGLLPVGTTVKVTDVLPNDRYDADPNPRTYIGRVVGYDMGGTKYQVGARYGGWGRWLYMDGGSWAFPTKVVEVPDCPHHSGTPVTDCLVCNPDGGKDW